MAKPRSDSSELGDQLVSEFRSAFIAIATSQAAQFAAELSEQALLGQLSYASGGNVLQPTNLKGFEQTISHDSLDAHVKKFQADQINERTNSLLADATASIDQYRNRRVRVVLLPNADDTLEALWFSPHTGERLSPYKRTVIQGTITEVMLEQNVLLVRPPYFVRLVSRDLQAYVVHIINPQTGEPAVTLDIH